MAELEKQPKKNLSGSEKGFLAFLCMVALLIILLGFGYIAYSIRAPFLPQLAQPGATAEIFQGENLLSLQEKDTDQDGLSDFEEIYVYGTSVYLEDSDSDGYNDKEEIEAASNPLIAESTPLNPEVETSGASFELAAGQNEPLTGELTMDEIRENLRQAGISEDILSKVDDATMLEIYQETIAEVEQGSTALPTSGVSDIIIQSGEADMEYFQNLTAQEMREYLILSGADEEILVQISDEDLKILFLQALEEMEIE